MPAPVRHTCPDIDAVIKKVKEAYKAAEQGRKRATEENFTEYFSDVENELWGVVDLLEDLRKDNQALREWGTEKEQEISVLEDQIYQLELNASIAD